MTQEEIVLRGELAELYLNDGALMGFVAEMQQDLLSCIGNTEPEDHKERTKLYYQHRGLQDLIAHLTVYTQAAKLINEKNEDQEAIPADSLDDLEM